MDLNEILVFSKVVARGSFTEAARELEMPKSTVSRKVSDLEDRLGARLLQRTTRKLSLTDAGRAYHERIAGVVAQIEDAERVVGRLQETPRGAIRVTTPLNFDFLGAILASFLRRYPEVSLDVVCTDRVVNLVDEGFDVAVRAGKLGDSAMIARNLGVARRLLVATPDYLTKSGRPRTPRDLAKHTCLIFGPDARWLLHDGTRTVDVSLAGRFRVNDFDLLRDATMHSVGIALLPEFLAMSDVRAGRLIRVLEAWTSVPSSIHAVYPSARHLSPKLRVFLDHLESEMTPPPWDVTPRTAAKRARRTR